jgi:hypothetical protein
MEVRMTTAIASTKTPELYPFIPSQTAGREIQVSESIRFAALTERRQDITLRTKEGDIVTLSMDQETVAVYSRDGRLSLNQQYAEATDGDQISYESLAGETREWFGIESSREFSLTIEGDLSREEMRDIRKALHRIHQMMGRAFGVDAVAEPRRSGLAGLDTLAGIEVDIQKSRTILAARATSVSALTYGADGQTAQAPHQVSTPERLSWQAAANEAVGIVEETGIESKHFVEPLRGLFRHWAGKMRRHHRAFEPMVRMMAKSVFDQLQIMPVNNWRRGRRA